MADSHYLDPNSHLGGILGASHLQKGVFAGLGMIDILFVVLLGFINVWHYHKCQTSYEQGQMDQRNIEAIYQSSSAVKLMLSDMHMSFLSIDQLSQVLLKL
jgi:hypothetical protein